AHADVVPMVEGDDIVSRRHIVQSEVTCRDAPLASADALRASAAAIRQAMADKAERAAPRQWRGATARQVAEFGGNG
ncbi:hypothetical protein, partial [Stenotrophomonas maltophilia]|uniref:hypothetical protein n=1 Tax=Stenotrophomonas maltophilia TaxID=40324 RepID=UPI001952EABC